MGTPRSALRYQRPMGPDEQQADAPVSSIVRASRSQGHKPLRTWQERTAYDGTEEGQEKPETEPGPLVPAGQIQWTTTADKAAGPAVVSDPRRAPQPPPHAMPPGKRCWRMREMHPLMAIGLGLALAILVYTACWAGRTGLSHLGNDLRYGSHAPSDTITAGFGSVSATIYATNAPTRAGRVLTVLIVPTGQKTVTILTEPLLPAVWGDTSQVTPSLVPLPHHRGVQLVLTGDPSYVHFSTPVQETFTIVAGGKNFHIVQAA